MDLYITFFSFRDHSLFVHNGFSFGVENTDESHFTFYSTTGSLLNLKSKIDKLKPKRIFCSLLFREQLESIRSLIDERWILGGPLVSRCFLEDLVPKSGETIFKGPIEHFFGKEISSKFSFYFKDLVLPFSNFMPVSYSVSLAFGCYWSKCNFCTYREIRDWTGGTVVERPSIDLILSSLPVFEGKHVVINTCVDCLTPKLLRSILSADKSLNFFSFLRPDKEIIDILEEEKDLTNQKFSVGLEAPSQNLVDKLNKGIRLENVKRLVKVVSERNGTVVLSTMESFPFITRDDILQAKEFVKNLEKIVDEKTGNVYIFSNGKMNLPESEVKKIDKPFFKESYSGWYHFSPQEESEDFILNKEFEEVMKKSKLFRG